MRRTPIEGFSDRIFRPHFHHDGLTQHESSPCKSIAESFNDADVQATLSSSPRNVFFLRTTNETRLSALEECAIRSAALKNPHWRINVFSNSLHCGTLKGEHPNIHVVRYSIPSVLSGYPALLDWYRSRVWDMAYRGAHISDGLRLALLHAYGGVYLDTDVLSLRPLDGLRNAVGTEDEWMLNNAVIVFEKGHPFLRQAIHTFPATFDAWYWGWNGPRLFSRVWKAYLAPPGHSNVLVVPRSEYYPLGWQRAELLVAPAAQHPDVVSHVLSNARMVHAWHHITKAYLDRAAAAEAQRSRYSSRGGGGGGGSVPPQPDIRHSAAIEDDGTVDGINGQQPAPPGGRSGNSHGDSSSESGTKIVDVVMAAACGTHDAQINPLNVVSAAGDGEAGFNPASAGSSFVHIHHRRSASSGQLYPVITVSGVGTFPLTLDAPTASNKQVAGATSAFVIDASGSLGDENDPPSARTGKQSLDGEQQQPLPSGPGRPVKHPVAAVQHPGVLPFGLETEPMLRQATDGRLVLANGKPVPSVVTSDGMGSCGMFEGQSIPLAPQGVLLVPLRQQEAAADAARNNSMRRPFDVEERPEGWLSHLQLPSSVAHGQQLTLSFWVNSLADAVSLRPLRQRLPAVDELTAPNVRDLKTPPAPLSLESLRAAGIWQRSGIGQTIDSVNEGLAVFGNALVIAIEDGRVTAGTIEGELVRSETPINDGQWHHVVIAVATGVASSRGGWLGGLTGAGGGADGQQDASSFKADDDSSGAGAGILRGGKVKLQLNLTIYVDGIYHALKSVSIKAKPSSSGAVSAGDLRRFILTTAVFGQLLPPAAKTDSATNSDSVLDFSPPLHIDGFAVFPRLLHQDAIAKLRNHQLVLSNSRQTSTFRVGPCMPYLPWLRSSRVGEAMGDVLQGEAPPASTPLPSVSEQAPRHRLVDQQQAGWVLLHPPVLSHHVVSGSADALGPRLLIVILSDGRPESVAARQACRATWLQLGLAASMGADKQLHLGAMRQRHFLIVPSVDRSALANEADAYQDLLFVDAPDSYGHVSNKVLLALAEVTSGCVRPAAAALAGGHPLTLCGPDGFAYDYLVKTDHDVFVRLDRLHAELESMRHTDSRQSLWWGFAYTSIPPVRDYGDRNADLAVTVNTFPPYTAGVLYVLSSDVIEGILSLTSHQLSANEDQNVGLWVEAVNQKRALRSLGGTAGGGNSQIVVPRHDLRMQQWSVCNEDQLTLHPAPPDLMRITLANIRSGYPMCAGSGYGTCGLCHPCSLGGDWSWFVCDAETGASLAEHVPVEEVARLGWGASSSGSSSGGLAHLNRDGDAIVAAPDSVQSSLGHVWWALPASHDPSLLSSPSLPLAPGTVSNGGHRGSSTHRPSSSSSSTAPHEPISPCAWPHSGWSTLDAGAVKSSAKQHDGSGQPTVTVSCSAGCSSIGSVLSCGAAAVFYPPAAESQCNSTISSAYSRGENERQARKPAHCPASASSFLSSWMGSVASTYTTVKTNLRALHQAVMSEAGPCATASSKSNDATDEDGTTEGHKAAEVTTSHSLRSPWLLVTAQVDTSGGGCTLVDPETAQPVEPGSGDLSTRRDAGYRRYPRFGSFDFFCGLFVDVRHEDGHVSTFRSPFARNASAYVHTESLYLAHPSLVRDARVSVYNSGPGRPVPITVRDLTLLPLPIHPGWVPQKRLVLAEALAAKGANGWIDPRLRFSGVLLPLRLLDPGFASTLYLSCPLTDVTGLAALLVVAAGSVVAALLSLLTCMCLWRSRGSEGSHSVASWSEALFPFIYTNSNSAFSSQKMSHSSNRHSQRAAYGLGSYFRVNSHRNNRSAATGTPGGGGFRLGSAADSHSNNTVVERANNNKATGLARSASTQTASDDEGLLAEDSPRTVAAKQASQGVLGYLDSLPLAQWLRWRLRLAFVPLLPSSRVRSASGFSADHHEPGLPSSTSQQINRASAVSSRTHASSSTSSLAKAGLNLSARSRLVASATGSNNSAASGTLATGGSLASSAAYGRRKGGFIGESSSSFRLEALATASSAPDGIGASYDEDERREAPPLPLTTSSPQSSRMMRSEYGTFTPSRPVTRPPSQEALAAQDDSNGLPSRDREEQLQQQQQQQQQQQLVTVPATYARY